MSDWYFADPDRVINTIERIRALWPKIDGAARLSTDCLLAGDMKGAHSAAESYKEFCAIAAELDEALHAEPKITHEPVGGNDD